VNYVVIVAVKNPREDLSHDSDNAPFREKFFGDNLLEELTTCA
jgi:hypothetical protein